MNASTCTVSRSVAVILLASGLSGAVGCRCGDGAESRIAGQGPERASTTEHGTGRTGESSSPASLEMPGEMLDEMPGEVSDELAGFELAPSRSTLALPTDPRLTIGVALDALQVDGQPIESLENGALGDDADLDALHSAVEGLGGDRGPMGAPIVINIDRRIPLGTVFAILGAVSQGPYEIALSVDGPTEEPSRLSLRRPEEEPDWLTDGWLDDSDGAGIAAGPSNHSEQARPRQAGALRLGPNGEQVYIPPQPVAVSDWRQVPVRLSAQRGGVWLLAGRRDLQVPGSFAVDIPRDLQHPNLPASRRWEPGSEISTWMDWSTVEDELTALQMVLLDQRLVPDVEVAGAPELPFEVLVRLVDATQLDVPADTPFPMPYPPPRLLLPQVR